MSHNKLIKAEQLYRSGKLDEAYKILTQQLKRGLAGHDKIVALGIVGSITLFQKKYDEAAKYHQLYLNLRPDNYEALENLLFILHNLGKVHKMLPFYERALEINPTEDMRINYGFCLCDIGRQEEGLAVLEPYLNHKRAWSFYWHNKFLITPGREMFAQFAHPNTAPEGSSKMRLASAYLHRALTAWQADDGSAFKEVFQEFIEYADSLEGQKEAMPTQREYEIQVKNRQNVRAYRSYLEKFMPMAQPIPVDESKPQLYLLGDSHALPPHRQHVEVLGQAWQLQARLIQGANWWMLANPKTNEIGNAILHQINFLPEEATVLISMGEIDCRHNGGMWAAHKKTGKSLEKLREETIPPAIEKLVAVQGNRTFMACGIPTVERASRTGDDWKNLPEEEKDIYIEHVIKSDAMWKEMCIEKGWGFVDVQQGTQNEKGVVTVDDYIDGYHLKPHILPRLLKENLTPPQ